jgi:hypothetical protein
MSSSSHGSVGNRLRISAWFTIRTGTQYRWDHSVNGHDIWVNDRSYLSTCVAIWAAGGRSRPTPYCRSNTPWGPDFRAQWIANASKWIARYRDSAPDWRMPLRLKVLVLNLKHIVNVPVSVSVYVQSLPLQRLSQYSSRYDHGSSAAWNRRLA